MMSSTLPSLVRFHKALDHPARLRTLPMLRNGELSVCQITAVLGLAPFTVSAHLEELWNAGLNVERKHGKCVNVGLARSESVNTVPGRVLEQLQGDSQVAEDDRLASELRGTPGEVLCRHGLETERSPITLRLTGETGS